MPKKAAVAKAWVAVPLERFQKCMDCVMVLMERALSRAEKPGKVVNSALLLSWKADVDYWGPTHL